MERLKKFLKNYSKIILAIFVVLLLLGLTPYCKGVFAEHNYYLVTHDVTAEQLVAIDKDDGIIVEFNCSGEDFSKILSKFEEANDGLRLDRIETIGGDSPKQDKHFVVIFFKKGVTLVAKFSWRLF